MLVKFNVVFISLILFLIFSFSCRNDKGPLPVTTVSECDSVVYYTNDIAPIMTSKCALPGCHQAGDSYGDFTTYSGMKIRLDDGTIKSCVFDNTPYPMPLAGSTPLTTIELKKLNCWIKQGYPNNSKSPSSGNTCTAVISYSVSIAPIISANCSSVTVCHGTGSVNGDYTTYAGLQQVANNGLLYNKVVVLNDLHNQPVVVPPLSDTAISKINCWIQQSSPNN